MAQSAALADQFIEPDQQGVYTNLNYDILGGIAHKIRDGCSRTPQIRLSEWSGHQKQATIDVCR
jgi:hypothetical protein